MILCDIGNTTIDIYQDGSIVKSRINDFDPNSINDTVYFISVNHMFSERVKDLSGWINIETMVDRSRYYSTMGIDRIMVCEAVEHGVIVDAGSAVTVDVMLDGVYQGGYIALGLRSAQDAYKRLSPALSIPFNFEVDLTIMAKNTSDAVTLGYFAPLIQSISMMKYPIFLTGGDAPIFSKWLIDATLDEALIFKGMKKLIEKGNGC